MRLAYEQGLLSQPRINRWQLWALTYMLSWIRWDQEAKEESFIKHSLAVNDWDKYVEVYAPPVINDMLHNMEQEEELPVSPDEFREINDWLKKADKMRVTTAAQVPGPDEGWI